MKHIKRILKFLSKYGDSSDWFFLYSKHLFYCVKCHILFYTYRTQSINVCKLLYGMDRYFITNFKD